MCGYAMIIEEWARSDVGFHAVGRRQKLTALVIQSWPHKSAQADKVVRVLRTGSKIDHLDSRLRSPACGRGARGTASRKSPVSERRAFLAEFAKHPDFLGQNRFSKVLQTVWKLLCHIKDRRRSTRDGAFCAFHCGCDRGARPSRDERRLSRLRLGGVSSAAGTTLRTGAAGPGKSGAGRGDGASAEVAGRQEGPCSAQTVPGTGVWHHQISARIPSIFIARARQGARRGEPCDHGLEHQTDVRPQPRLTRPCTAWRRESRRLPVIRRDHNAIWTPPNVRRKLAVAKSPFAFSRNA